MLSSTSDSSLSCSSAFSFILCIIDSCVTSSASEFSSASFLSFYDHRWFAHLILSYARWWGARSSPWSCAGSATYSGSFSRRARVRLLSQFCDFLCFIHLSSSYSSWRWAYNGIALNQCLGPFPVFLKAPDLEYCPQQGCLQLSRIRVALYLNWMFWGSLSEMSFCDKGSYTNGDRKI